MKLSDRSRILVTHHDGTIIKCYCLPMGSRSLFLEHWEDAWQILIDSILANAAAERGKALAIAYLWDEGRREDGDEKANQFVWLTTEMLKLHRLDVEELDIHQVTELLFFSEKGNGLLVDLQFPAVPPGMRGKAESGDPYCKMLASLSMRTGDWLSAQQAIDTIPYDQIVQICAEQERLYEESKRESERGSKAAPAPTISPSAVSKDQQLELEIIRQEALRKFQQGQKEAIADTHAQAMQAIAKKIEEDRAKQSESS